MTFSLLGTGSGGGKDGRDGLSAYEIALKNGFIGTEQDWLESLIGGMPIINLSGVHMGQAPPETTSELWVKPLTE